MPGMSPLPRPLRSFSLRTLMALVGVSAAFCGWLVHERLFVQARRAALAEWASNDRVDFTTAERWAGEMNRFSIDKRTTQDRISWIRRELGDVSIEIIWLDGQEVEPVDWERAGRLFPEARLIGP
jgi:hypothetical protein